MSKGKNRFMEEELEEEVVSAPVQKKDMFAEKNNEIVKPEGKDERIVAMIEPSLKKRLVSYCESLGVSHAVIIRAALQEYLDKRGV